MYKQPHLIPRNMFVVLDFVFVWREDSLAFRLGASEDLVVLVFAQLHRWVVLRFLHHQLISAFVLVKFVSRQMNVELSSGRKGYNG